MTPRGVRQQILLCQVPNNSTCQLEASQGAWRMNGSTGQKLLPLMYNCKKKTKQIYLYIYFGFHVLQERPSEKIEAKLDLILSRLDAIERHLSINNFKQSQETPPCVKKVGVFLLSLFGLFSFGYYFSVYLFSFSLKLEFCYWFFFFQPKYESARRCNASDVGEISGIGSSPTSSLVGAMHCNGCFKNGMRAQFQQ